MAPPKVEEAMPAESLSAWLTATRRAMRKGEQSQVPCGDCRGCCTSGHFILIGPEEKKTLDRIPKALLFPAPGLPKGYRLMGYDHKGHCPMFIDNACSIYAARPRTCRQYDCRVFAATGIEPDEEKTAIVSQVGRWKFATGEPADSMALKSIRRAVEYLLANRSLFPPGSLPGQATQLAVFAVQVSELFSQHEIETTDASWIPKILARRGDFLAEAGA